MKTSLVAGISLCLVPRRDLLSYLQLRADKQYKAKNGPLDCVQKNYHVAESTPDSKTGDGSGRLRQTACVRTSKIREVGPPKELNVTACMTPIYRRYNVAVDRYA